MTVALCTQEEKVSRIAANKNQNNLETIEQAQQFNLQNISTINMDSLGFQIQEAQQFVSSSKSTSSEVEGASYQNHKESSASQSSHMSLHNQNTMRQLSFGTGAMLLLFFFILSFSTSSVTGIPLGQDSSPKNPTNHYNNMKHGLELTSSLESHQKPKRSTGIESIDTVGGVIEDLGGNEQNYMVQLQPQGQLYYPSVIKSNEIGMGINLGGQVEESNEEDGIQRIIGSGHGGHQFGRQEQEKVDDGPYRSYPSSLRRLSKTEILQNDEDESTRKEWETVIDPHLYLITEWYSNALRQQQQQRMRRNVGPSLSIVNPLDVLRQRLLLEIARRKMRQSHNQIIANAEILKNIGRR